MKDFFTLDPTRGIDGKNGLVLVLVALAAWFVVWLVIKIAKSRMAIPLLILVVIIGGMAWLIAGDKNNDGLSDTMIIKAVQPTGDLQTDTGYSEVNQTNAKTNAINAAAISLYVVIGATVFLAVFVVVALFKHKYQ